MAERHLLYLTVFGMQVARTSQGQISLAEHLAPADGPSALTGWLQGHPRSRITLLVDLPDERYHLETLPVVGRRDRRQLIARRQAQLRLDTPYITHQSLGRGAAPTAGGAPGEKILFAALHRPAALQPWLAAFQQSGRAIDSLGMAAHLAAELAPRLTGLPPVALLVWTTPAGLRVSCLEGGRLRFSRLTPSSSLAGGDGWQACGDEVRRTHQYLVGQRAIERGQPTPVFVLAHPREHGTVASACPDTGELRFQTVDLPQLAARCGLQSVLEDSDSLPLLLHLASRSRQLPQLAPPGRGRPRRLPAPATAIGVLAASLLAVSLVVAADRLLEAYRLRQEAASLLDASLAEEARASSLRDSTPALPLPSETLQADFARLATLQPFEKTPTAFLSQLAKALDALPGVELAALEWSLGLEGLNPALSATIALQLPAAAPGRPDLSPQVAATIHRHLGIAALDPAVSAPEASGPLRSPGGQVDARGRLTLAITLPASLR